MSTKSDNHEINNSYPCPEPLSPPQAEHGAAPNTRTTATNSLGLPDDLVDRVLKAQAARRARGENAHTALFVVLVVLGRMARSQPMGVTRLVDETGLSNRGVIAAIREGVELGVIREVQVGKRGSRTRYALAGTRLANEESSAANSELSSRLSVADCELSSPNEREVSSRSGDELANGEVRSHSERELTSPSNGAVARRELSSPNETAPQESVCTNGELRRTNDAAVPHARAVCSPSGKHERKEGEKNSLSFDRRRQQPAPPSSSPLTEGALALTPPTAPLRLVVTEREVDQLVRDWDRISAPVGDAAHWASAYPEIPPRAQARIYTAGTKARQALMRDQARSPSDAAVRGLILGWAAEVGVALEHVAAIYPGERGAA